MIKPMLPPFKNWVLQNFPFIEDDFDAITNYQLYCKIVEYMKSVDTYMQGVDTFLTEVENYFNNLDVQEEINNKLDKMVEDGTLESLMKPYLDTYIQPQINTLNDNFNSLNTNVNNTINTMNEKINTLINATPEAVSSTDEMTDTSKIYINTTNGYWYYYDEEWKQGGIYQATGIADKSINYFTLDNYLNNNFNMVQGENLTLTLVASNQFMRKDGTLVSLTNAMCYSYSLEAGKIYHFDGYDDSLLCSLVIKNSSNEVVFASNLNNLTRKYTRDFLITDANLTAYISSEAINNTIFKHYINGYLREITSINSNVKNTKKPTLINTANDCAIMSTSVNQTNIAFLNNLSGYKTYIYQMSKGLKYQLHSEDYSYVCGLLILKDDLSVLYASSTTNLGDTRNIVDYVYEASDNGYIILSYNGTKGSISIINDINDSPLYGKSITFNGDSICAGTGDAVGGYGKIISDKFNMQYQNIAQGGGTIASETYTSNNTPRYWINENISNMYLSDYAILEGGVNDSSLGVTLGHITDSYNNTLDTSTFYGAFENMLKQLITRFKGKKYGYIFVHQMTSNYRITNNENTSYYWAAKKCCEKWGVPYLDLNDKVPPMGMFYSGTADSDLLEIKTTYTNNGDGWHPNKLGYETYYVDKIIEWLESL